MALKVSKPPRGKSVESLEVSDDTRQAIQQAAYFKWLAENPNGTPVSEEDTVRYWCEAEQEFFGTQSEEE